MSKTYLLSLFIVVTCQVYETYGGGGSCLATPLIWGPECKSSTSVIGNTGTKVRYSVRVIGSTMVCCQGYSPASRTFLSIGCGYGTYSKTLNWGNFIDTPKIKCKGSPLAGSVTWRH